jgi:hypothetical protein
VGAVRLVFSTTKTNLKTATPDDVKILMTNDLRLSVRDVVALYSLRWQIELFFKELKSTLGFHQYQFQRFEAVEGWMELVLTAFLYLESYRVHQMARRDLSDEEKRWWRHQRTYGLCQAVRLASEQKELQFLADRLETPGGTQKLKRILRNSFPQGIPGHGVNLVKNSATSKLARRVGVVALVLGACAIQALAALTDRHPTSRRWLILSTHQTSSLSGGLANARLRPQV